MSGSVKELIRRLNLAGVPRKDYRASSSWRVNSQAVAQFYGDAARSVLSVREKIERQGLGIHEWPIRGAGDAEIWILLPERSVSE